MIDDRELVAVAEEWLRQHHRALANAEAGRGAASPASQRDRLAWISLAAKGRVLRALDHANVRLAASICNDILA